MKISPVFSLVASVLTFVVPTGATRPTHYSHNLNPFQIVCNVDDTSYFMARDGFFYFSQDGCQEKCPIYKNGTVFKIDGKGHAFLDVSVEGGQQVYVDPQDGSLRYTPAGSPTLPEGAIAFYFDRIYNGIKTGGYSFSLRLPPPSRHGTYDWEAVPPKPLVGSDPKHFGGYRDGKIFIAISAYNQTKKWPYEAAILPYKGPSPPVHSY